MQVRDTGTSAIARMRQRLTSRGRHRARGLKATTMLASLALVAAVGVVGLEAGPEQATAAAPATPKGTWATVGHKGTNVAHGTAAHGFRSSNTDYGYCALDTQNGPSASSGAVNYAAPTKVTGTYTGANGGASIAAGNIKYAGYILSKWGRATGVQASAVDYALGQLSSSASNPAKIFKAAGTAEVKSLGESYIAEAKKYAGSRAVKPTVTISGNTGTVGAIGVKLNGKWAPGYAYTAVISGNATWVANGTKTVTGTTAATSGGASRSIKVTGGGTITVTLTVKDLPDSDLYVAKHATWQDIFVPSEPVDASGSDSDTGVQISLSTSASKKVLSDGRVQISDTITLTGGPGGATISDVRVRLWKHSDDPDATITAGSGTKADVEAREPQARSLVVNTYDLKLDADGEVTFKTPVQLTTDDPGVYTFVVHVPAQLGMSAITHRYGLKAETVRVDGLEYDASVVTRAAVTRTAQGSSHTDRITLSDLPPSTTLTGLTARLFRHSTNGAAQIDEQDTVPAGATQVGTTVTFSVTTNADGEATYTTPSRTDGDRGVWTWVVAVPAQSGTGWDLNSYTSEYGIPAETVRMLPPVITTVAAVDDGEWTGVDEYTVTFTDTINLGRATPGASGPVTAELYYAGTTSPDQQATVPAGAQRVGTATGTLTANASGAATLALPVKVMNPRDGHYTFVVRTPAGVLGFTMAYVSAYGIDEETVSWDRPPENDPFSITTQVSDQVIVPGGCVHDTLKVVDDRDVLGTHPANVTVTAWGPFVARPTPGAVINPARDAKLGSTQVRITGEDVYAAPEICTDPNGPGGYVVFTYAYPRSAVYSPPFVGYDAFEDLTVYATETALVQWQPKVTTNVSSQVVEPGDELVDEFTVTGGRPGAELDVVFTAHGPLLAEPVESATVPAGTPTLGSVTVRVTLDAKGEARGQTPGIKTDPEGPRGFYTWTDEIAESAETFGGKPVQAGWRSTYGVATETALVPWTPSVATRVTAPYVLAGDTFRDEIEVTGLRPQEAVEVASSIWKVRETDLPETPEAMTPELIERLGDPWAEVTTTVTADADGIARGVSPEVSTDPTGAFVYVVTETFTASTDTFGGERVRASWTGPFGVPSEIVRTVRVTTQATPHVLAGTPTTDVARVEGYVPDGSTLVFKQYDQDAGDDVTLDELVWTSEPVAIDAQDTDQVAEYTSPEAPGRDPGTTYWREELHIPGMAEPIHVGAPRLPNETTTIVRVTTKAQPTVVAGTPLVDVALVEGPVPAGSRLVWQLYAQDAGEDVTLDELVATTEAVTVEGPGEFESPAVTYDVPGTVYWREALYLPGQEEPIHVGAPRLPAETTTIVRVTTKAQPTVVAGTPLVDVALVEGPVPAGSRLVWQLYAQDAGEDVTLDELVATTEAVTVDGPGEFESPAVTYDVPGTVYWREALYLPGQETPIHVGAPRLPNETTTITPVPTPPSDGEDTPPSDGEDTPTSDGEDVPDSEGDGLPETGAFVVGSALLAALLLAAGVVMRVRRRAVA